MRRRGSNGGSALESLLAAGPDLFTEPIVDVISYLFAGEERYGNGSASWYLTKSG